MTRGTKLDRARERSRKRRVPWIFIININVCRVTKIGNLKGGLTNDSSVRGILFSILVAWRVGKSVDGYADTISNRFDSIQESTFVDIANASETIDDTSAFVSDTRRVPLYRYNYCYLFQ